LPSLKKKLNYVSWDLNQFRTGKGLNYSDSERIYSLSAGIEIFKESPITGIGIGDLKSACKKIYTTRYQKELDHYPHNQYLFVLAGMGLIGFLFYAFAFLGPLVVLRGRYDPYFLSLYAVVIISGLAENTLERTFSIGFYLFFVGASLCYLYRPWVQQK